MNNSDNLPPLLNFNVVAVHRVTGKPQFATIFAPSQVDADDFVADVQPDWIIIRDNSDLLTDDNYDGEDLGTDLDMINSIFNN